MWTRLAMPLLNLGWQLLQSKNHGCRVRTLGAFGQLFRLETNFTKLNFNCVNLSSAIRMIFA
jgi:hypothetical protein